MGKAVGAELNSLLMYYGERPDSPEAPKPEDFFSLVISFSTSLQVCIHILLPLPFLNQPTQKSALEVNDYRAKSQPRSITAVEKSQEIGTGDIVNATTDDKTRVTQSDSQSKWTPTRGGLEQAIRSMRQGKMGSRERSIRLSKIFVDGTNSRQSHLYDQ
jgi:diaphanous 1